jgi:hypothetical protein
MKSISTCILLLLQFHLSAQCLMKEVPLSQRRSGSDLIVEGRVIASKSFWNEDHTMIYTSNTVEILKIFKGQVTTSTIDVLTQGGTVGLDRIKVSPSLSLQTGNVGIFLCETVKRFKALPSNTRSIPRYEAYGSEQGFIRYDLATGTAADPFKKYRSIPNELYKTFSPLMNYKVVKKFEINNTDQSSVARITAISGFSPTTLTAGTGTVLTINGSNFGATQGAGFVEFRNADDGGATYITPLPSQYLSWSATQITVEVPQNAGTGDIRVTQGVTFTSAGTLTIDYAHSNVDFDPGTGTIAYQTDHINDNGTGGYTWRMNTAFDANTAARASFMRAFDSWRCGTGINWEVGATTAIDDAVSDGTNIITFDDAAPLGPGFLGVCYSYWGGCISGSTIVWRVNELDIIFDNGDNFAPLTWEFGTANPTLSEFDFESVALHELGHGHQLNHVISPGAVMHYALSNGSTGRTLSATDLAGGNFVQAKSEVANICGPGAMTEFTGCSALPITISSVNAFQEGNGVRVEWTNASESDVDHYEVEESDDGSAFSTAANVAPKSNDHTQADYQWFDAQVSNGSNFYRVKAVGHNGEIKYSSVATVNFTSSSRTFSVYPNPGNGKNLTVSFNNLPQGTYTLAIYNTVGQRLYGKTLVHSGGNAVQHISLPGIAAGLYSVQLRGKNINEKPIMLTIK